MRRPIDAAPAILLAAAVMGASLAAGAQAQTAVESPVQDDPRAIPLFDARVAVGDLLSAFKAKGKVVVLTLHGGVSYAGKVKQVGPSAVVLTALRGKEFYDAWIPFAAIVAMEERVRIR